MADATGRLIYSNRKRPYAPEYYNVQITESSSRSLYRAFTTTFNVRRPRFTIDTYYTLSWKYSYDDQEQDYSAIAYDSAANLKNDYNYSLTDQRHQFIASGIYTLPFNFEVSSTARLNSARPFNAMPMLDYNKDDVFTDRPVIDGKVILRNAFRSRAFYDVSLRFQRHFTLPNEKGRFTASVEFFNLDMVVEYTLLLNNATTAAKVGYYLDQHREELMVEDRHLQPLWEMRPRQAHYLDRNRRESGSLAADWNLVIPAEITERSWAEVL